MKKILLMAAVVALAACGGGERADMPADTVPAMTPAPTTADTAMGADTMGMPADTMARDTAQSM